MDLPCPECLVFIMCKNKNIIHVMTDCDILRRYLYADSNSMIKEHVHLFCEAMNRTLRKSGSDYIINPKGS